MTIYQWFIYDTQENATTVFTAKTKLEADLKAWELIVNIVDGTKAKNVYDIDNCDITNFEEFHNSAGCYFPFWDWGGLDCTRVTTEIKEN